MKMFASRMLQITALLLGACVTETAPPPPVDDSPTDPVNVSEVEAPVRMACWLYFCDGGELATCCWRSGVAYCPNSGETCE